MKHTLSFALLILVTIGVQFVIAAGESSVPTEADFKKMKIKGIRLWLDDRGLVCKECQEKADFVKFAVQHAAAKVLPGKQKLPLPEGKFWEVWAKVAKEMCEATAKKKDAESAGKKICPAFELAWDSVFMQHGKRTAQKLKKKPDALLKTSWGDVYQQAGRRLINKALTYCFQAPNQQECSSTSKMQSLLETPNKMKGVDLKQYLTNVGIENTNTMYEIMKEKMSAKDEL